MKIKTLVFEVCILMAVCAMAAPGLPENYYESFTDGVPDYFEAAREESLSISPWHYKYGGYSLRWDWVAGEELIIRRGIGDPDRAGGFSSSPAFSVWLYMREPLSEALVFEFREGARVTGSFRFPLEFAGWRQGRLRYDRNFTDGRPTSQVDNIRIAAPTDVEQGTVFLDFIKYNTLTHHRAVIVPEEVARWRPPEPDEELFPRPERVTEAQLAGISKLLGEEESPGIADARVNTLLEHVEKLGIVRDEHGVRGPPVHGQRYYLSAPREHGHDDIRYWPDEHGPDGPAMQSHAAMSQLAYSLAVAYRASDEARQRERLAEAFLLLADHLHEQAFQAGSGFRSPGPRWLETIVLMRNVLADKGRLEPHRDFVLYTSNADMLFAEDDADIRSDMDFYGYYAPSLLLRLCFIQVDPAEQVRWLNAFKSMIERSILKPAGALKIDGSAWHHGGHYPSYTRGAFSRFPPLVLKAFNDTPWRLSAEAHERFRRAMLAKRIYCNKLYWPLSTAGRSPFVGRYVAFSPGVMETMARLGSPDGEQEIDAKMASAYLRLAPEAVDEEPWRSLGIEPEPHPTGAYVMPYAGLLLHRRDNWLAAVKGQSRYVWGSERQARRNCYGLFQGLGSLEILAGGTPVTAGESGRPPRGDGWDWRRFEGTTVPQLPLEDIEISWRYPPHEHTYSPEKFMGGLSHQGRQGVFAMIVNEDLLLRTGARDAVAERTLTGRKSWFFFDDQIVCLGSDITSDVAEYPTQTTLCQKLLATNETGRFMPTLLNGEEIVAFPKKLTLDGNDHHWFMDVQRTGYYVPAGQKLTVTRKQQKSRDTLDVSDTEDNFLTAWIDHGASPVNAGYEYMLKIRATPEDMRGVAQAPPYRVVQRDRAAHIVWHVPSRQWAGAFFEPQDIAAHTVAAAGNPHAAARRGGGCALLSLRSKAAEKFPVKSVDRPSLIMADTVDDDGRLRMSVADPDLNLQQGVNVPQELRVTLRGKWRLAEVTATVNAWELPEAPGDVRVVSAAEGETVLEILCRHGASYDMILEPAG